MNYRHAYHAGNFADCFKHALLVDLLDWLARKPAGFFVLDTHAGAGRYDLNAPEAQRTDEAARGIRRLIARPSPVLDRYLGLVARLGLYPGSPALIRAVLRENDRMACCELHPADSSALRGQFRHDRSVAVHERSGWEALGALIPPKENRGLVFIDPPFESRDEFFTLAGGLCQGHGRFGHGIFAAWYPIKQMATVRGFHATLAQCGIRDIVAVELYVRATTDPGRLNGCGLLAINPPYQFEARARAIATAVLEGVGDGEPGAGISVIRLADE